MSAELNQDLNIIANSDLEIEYLNGDLNIIQKLDDEPNDVGGLTAAQLKAEFDKAGNIIKEYINHTLIPALLAADATEQRREREEESRRQAEDKRTAAESGRETAEQDRGRAEAERDSAERNRALAETGRAQAEEKRTEGESARNYWNVYTEGVTYVPGNKVFYEGSSYVNKAACKDILPTNSAYWTMIARKGNQGERGAAGTRGEMGYSFYRVSEAAAMSSQTFQRSKIISSGNEVRVGDFLITNDGTYYRVENAYENTVTGAMMGSFRGPVGLTGAPGAKGEQGESGADGEKGDKGDQGVSVVSATLVFV